MNPRLPALLLLVTSAFAQSAHIPTLHVTAFDGTPIHLPDPVHPRPAILVLGFSQSSRPQVADWGKRLAADPAFAFYELPVLAAVPRLLRPLILGHIRASVPPILQPHFAPLLTDETQWRQAVQYTAPDDAYLLLVDPTGTILWRAHGPLTDATFAALQNQRQQLQPRP
jgi:hypothetical protein